MNANIASSAADNGRVIVITGAGGAIGRATAQRFARDGNSVVALDLNLATATATVNGLDGPGRHLSLACDVSDRSQVEDGISEVLATYGRLDALVAAAGTNRDNLVFRMSDDDWLSVIATNLTGTFYLARACQVPMVAQRSGKIVLVSSRAAHGNVGQVNYSAAKAGLQGLMHALALELGRFGINVNAVAPGFVESEMTRRAAERAGLSFDEFKEQAASRNPRGLVGQPEHIAGVIAFLASEDAVYVHGQTIYATGGPLG